MNRIAILLLAAALSGCASEILMSSAEIAQKDENTCASYGIKPSDPVYASCRMTIAQMRQQRRADAFAQMSATGNSILAQQQSYINQSNQTLMPRQVRCNTSRLGMTLQTNCY